MSHIFARLTKVDEETHTVTGRACQETVDRDGEIMDYLTSKPLFQAWSAEVFADSGGLSHGNVRAMHSNVAAGILSDISFDDVEKSIDVIATITDDQEWKKVTSGTYTGFSIGGRYARKWQDISSGKPVTRYTAVPSEISLVDRPSVPTARFFQIHKRDGRVVKRAFANQQEVSNMKMSDELAKYLRLNKASHDAIRAVHAKGSTPLPTDLICKYVGAPGIPDAATLAIRKAQQSPRSLHPSANVEVSKRELSKMIKRGRRMRKVALPPQSSNGMYGRAVANTGATNRWDDEGTVAPQRVIVGGRVIGVPSQSNRDAAVNAIKADWARGSRRDG